MLLLFFLSPPRDRLQRHRFAFQMPHFNKGNAALQQGKRLAFASKSPQVSVEKSAGFSGKARRFGETNGNVTNENIHSVPSHPLRKGTGGKHLPSVNLS